MTQRRKILQATAAGALGAIAAPAIAQQLPSIRWRMAASFPPALDTCFGST